MFSSDGGGQIPSSSPEYGLERGAFWAQTSFGTQLCRAGSWVCWGPPWPLWSEASLVHATTHTRHFPAAHLAAPCSTAYLAPRWEASVYWLMGWYLRHQPLPSPLTSKASFPGRDRDLSQSRGGPGWRGGLSTGTARVRAPRGWWALLLFTCRGQGARWREEPCKGTGSPLGLQIDPKRQA